MRTAMLKVYWSMTLCNRHACFSACIWFILHSVLFLIYPYQLQIKSDQIKNKSLALACSDLPGSGSVVIAPSIEIFRNQNKPRNWKWRRIIAKQIWQAMKTWSTNLLLKQLFQQHRPMNLNAQGQQESVLLVVKDHMLSTWDRQCTKLWKNVSVQRGL